MTLHAAKGLEFPVVFMVGMEDGLFPNARCEIDPAKLEEERRLCYVGMTRAREQLIMTFADQRMLRGEINYNQPSPFLLDAGGKEALEMGDGVDDEVSYDKYADEPEMVSLNVGDKVYHQMFGMGTVEELDGMNATIKFKHSGTKKLNLAFAPLTKL
jgi:DNA helicase-2/ATP-dependent DNA helicase PcrA